MARSYYDDHFDPGADREELRERHQKKREISRPKVYVRYDEGAELYSMCKNTFIKLHLGFERKKSDEAGKFGEGMCSKIRLTLCTTESMISLKDVSRSIFHNDQKH